MVTGSVGQFCYQPEAERVKLVFEVRVRIAEDPSFDLKAGLAADVQLNESTPQ